MLKFVRSPGEAIIIADIKLVLLSIEDKEAYIEITCPNQIDLSVTHQNKEVSTITKNKENKFTFACLPQETININSNIKVYLIINVDENGSYRAGFGVDVPRDMTVYKEELARYFRGGVS